MTDLVKSYERRSRFFLVTIFLASSFMSSSVFVTSLPSMSSSVTLSSFTLTSSTPVTSSLARERRELPCDGLGCCEESNFGQGPLNLSTPTGEFDSRDEDEKTFIYHCVRYFTRFRWYRVRNSKDREIDLKDLNISLNTLVKDEGQEDEDALEPFPWGQQGRVWLLPGRPDNQTVVIRSARREDDATYVFVASNETHGVMGKFRLQITCREVTPSFATSEQPVQSVAEGAHKTLHCAVSTPDCPGALHKTFVFWVWHSFVSQNQTILDNGTLQSVSVLCDTNKRYGQKCDLLIRHVEAKFYHGEFICKMAGRDLTQTIQLVPINREVKSWLPYVAGSTGGVVVLVMVIVFIYWRCGHRIAFYCRTQPPRGHYKADGVILHGEDQEELVREHLLPQVRGLGYDILEQVTTPGKPELTEQLQAVEDSHSVLLTFSSREMAHDGNLHFLTQYVFTRKTPSTVLFIRCQDHNDLNERGNNATGQEEEEEVGEGLISSTGRNPWKNEALKPFRVLKLPRSLHLGESGAQSPSFREQRNVEKFLCSVQKYLPKKTSPDPSAKLRTPGRAATHPNTSSSASHRPLISDSSAETNGVRVSDYGPSSPSTYATSPGVEARQTEDGRPVSSSSSSSSPSSQPEPVVVEGVAPSSTVSPGNREGQAARESSAQDLRSPAARVLIQTEPEASSTRVSSPQTSFTSQEELDKADQGHHHHHPGNSHSEDFTPQTSTPSPDVSSSPQPDEALILSYTQDPQPDPSPSSTGISPEPSHNKAGGMNDRESGEEEEEEGREVDGDGEGIEGEGGKRGSGGPSTFLESQESGYHSPSSQPEAPAFEDVARTNAQTV